MVCEISGLLKWSEYQFWTRIWKPKFWNPRKAECLQFLVDSAFVDFFSLFWTSRSRETWSFKLVSQLFLFYAQQQNKVFMSTRLKKFKVAVRQVIQRKKSENLKNGNFWKPKKNPFQSWKRQFLITFKGSLITGPLKVNKKISFSGLKWILLGFSKSGWVRTWVLKSWVWKLSFAAEHKKEMTEK